MIVTDIFATQKEPLRCMNLGHQSTQKKTEEITKKLATGLSDEPEPDISLGPSDRLKAWLTKPFLFPSSVIARFLISFLFGFFVFLFLRVFLPFGLDKIPGNKTLFIVVYGCSTSLIISAWLFIFPLFSPGMFDPDRFTIRRYLILCFGNTMLINTINWIYSRTAGSGFIPPYGFVSFTLITFSVGVFPVVFLTLIIDKIRLELRTSQFIRMQVIDPERTKQGAPPLAFNVRNHLGAAQIRFSETDFICARSNGNYTTVYYRNNGEIRKELVRITLTNFFDQMNTGAFIIRCHRSAVVNRRHIKRVVSRSRSVELQMEELKEWIPVSRALPRELLNSSHNVSGTNHDADTGSPATNNV